MKEAELEKKIVDWIKKEVQTAGAKGIIFGMSGGLDSSVVAVLCQKSFPNNLMGLIMPCHSDEKDFNDAKLLADTFKIPLKVIILDAVLDNLYSQLVLTEPESNPDRTTSSNLKPRLRMITLYYFANLYDYLVIGTGNKSEFLMGYFTKFGDGGVDLLPLGNLYKTEVRKLAGYLKIPKSIIDKEPSAGLWEGQTDEAEMGITYEELDSILKGIDLKDFTGLDSEKVEKVEKQISKSEHKRELPKIFKI